MHTQHTIENLKNFTAVMFLGNPQNPQSIKIKKFLI
jgi:hypothetical protein